MYTRHSGAREQHQAYVHPPGVRVCVLRVCARRYAAGWEVRTAFTGTGTLWELHGFLWPQDIIV